jgi:hypothetical protein
MNGNMWITGCTTLQATGLTVIIIFAASMIYSNIFIRSMKPFLSPSAVKLRSELSVQENIDDDSITEAIRYSASNPSMTSANFLQNELVVHVFVEFVTV